jgi:uncharacterized membrane protein YfcA
MNDLINGLCGTIGGLFVFNNCYTLYKDKNVKGVSKLSTLFFTLWSYFILYYYSSLDQWLSLLGGILMALGNTIWLIMAMYYLKREQKCLTI